MASQAVVAQRLDKMVSGHCLNAKLKEMYIPDINNKNSSSRIVLKKVQEFVK